MTTYLRQSWTLIFFRLIKNSRWTMSIEMELTKLFLMMRLYRFNKMLTHMRVPSMHWSSLTRLSHQWLSWNTSTSAARLSWRKVLIDSGRTMISHQRSCQLMLITCSRWSSILYQGWEVFHKSSQTWTILKISCQKLFRLAIVPSIWQWCSHLSNTWSISTTACKNSNHLRSKTLMFLDQTLKRLSSSRIKKVMYKIPKACMRIICFLSIILTKW